MDKREFEVTKVIAITKVVEAFFNLLKLALVCGTLLFAIKLILDGIKPIIGQKASQIEALAKFVETFKIGSIFAYSLTGVFGCAWFAERKGKQRAIKLKAHYQALAEQNDPNRTSSGLTKLGHTPKTL
jgi:hypothetical protein